MPTKKEELDENQLLDVLDDDDFEEYGEEAIYTVSQPPVNDEDYGDGIFIEHAESTLPLHQHALSKNFLLEEEKGNAADDEEPEQELRATMSPQPDLENEMATILQAADCEPATVQKLREFTTQEIQAWRGENRANLRDDEWQRAERAVLTSISRAWWREQRVTAEEVARNAKHSDTTTLSDIAHWAAVSVDALDFSIYAAKMVARELQRVKKHGEDEREEGWKDARNVSIVCQHLTQGQMAVEQRAKEAFEAAIKALEGKDAEEKRKRRKSGGGAEWKRVIVILGAVILVGATAKVVLWQRK